ncbi:hypothetical protein CRYUN_Cryun12cG0072900 [Craigia yunnanensis]
MKRIEETEDCFILDFNPFDSIDIANLSVTNDGDDVDLSVLAEKGHVSLHFFCYMYICCSLNSISCNTCFGLVAKEIYTYYRAKRVCVNHYYVNDKV